MPQRNRYISKWQMQKEKGGTKMKGIFSPMLAPNEKIDTNTINYPIYGSYKMDGIRCLFINGQMLSRSFKPIRNKVLQEKFKPLKEYSIQHKHILDGELYMPGASFQNITSYVMTENKEVPAEFKFYCFDCVVGGDFPDILMPFENRIRLIPMGDTIVKVEQKKLYIPDDVQTMFEEALHAGYEGLILKSPNKIGRAHV